MFQSDDYEDALDDDSLSTIPDPVVDNDVTSSIEEIPSSIQSPLEKIPLRRIVVAQRQNKKDDADTPRKRKRKFPGPAGLLPDETIEKSHNINITASQVYTSSQNQIPVSVFEDGPWCTMLDDLKTYDYSPNKSTIAFIKNQYITHKFAGQRVPLLSGVIQNIDRTLQDPSITIRDQTGEIQGTLHHDAWEMYSCYLVPQFSVILLKNTTLLTTGGVSKKIYLNITLNNIVAIYCDEDSSYSHKDKRKSTGATKENSHENYILDRTSWKSDEILILRNASHVGVSSKRDVSDLNTSDSVSLNHPSQESLNEELAQKLFDGINIDALLGDFD